LLEIDVIWKTRVFLQIITQCKDMMSMLLLCKKHGIIKDQIFTTSQTPILGQNVVELVGRK